VAHDDVHAEQTTLERCHNLFLGSGVFCYLVIPLAPYPSLIARWDHMLILTHAHDFLA